MNKKLLIIMILSSILNFFGCKQKPEKSKEFIEAKKAFEEWENRKIYKVLTSEIIDTISDDDLEQAIFDNIYEMIKKDFSNEFEKISELTKGQQAFWSTWVLEGEVNNGGFNQYYFNSSGEFRKMAEKGFELIDAKKYCELTKRANQIYEENKERLEKFDDGTLESFSESYKDNPLNKLDDEFYDLGNVESISKLRIKYIRENKKEFISK